MTRRIPFIPTLVVLAAVATMIALGFWQLGRAHERDAINERLIRNANLPAATLAARDMGNERDLYRLVRTACPRVVSWSVRAGETVDGKRGWRHIATCSSTTGRQTFAVDMGVGSQPDEKAEWTGGIVEGRLVRGIDERGLRQRLAGDAGQRGVMIISNAPAPGLAPSKQPDPAQESNSSWAYTVQWFLFAATALVIYALALRKRWRAA